MLELKFAEIEVVLKGKEESEENDFYIQPDPKSYDDKKVAHFVFTDGNASQTFCFTVDTDQLIIALEAYKQLRQKE